MQITTDENGYITGFCQNNELGGAIEYTGVIPENFCPETCLYFRLTNGELIYDTSKETAAQNKALLSDELYTLYDWFYWYDGQVAQYNRAVRMGDTTGWIFDGSIEALDAEAATKQLRIREIREALS